MFAHLTTLKCRLAFVFLLSVCGLAQAATITADNVSQSAFQAAIDAAIDGDTVVIPAGTGIWTEAVTIPPIAITVRGAGIDETIIVDNINKEPGGGHSTLVIFTAAEKPFRLTGMTFRGMAPDPVSMNQGTVVLWGYGNKVRLDHLKFDKPGTACIRWTGAVVGVLDSSYFDTSNGTTGILLSSPSWGGHEHGDGSWAEPTYYGTDRAVYIEDNTFIGPGYAGNGPVDAYGGARMVFRNNSVHNDVAATHGTETPGRLRSVRSYEIYNNTFTTDALLFTGIFLRGGTGVIWGNTFSGSGGETGYQSMVVARNYRSVSPYFLWGQCDGTNPWDGNTDALGYPALDQVGRGQGDLISGYQPTPIAWPNQQSEPLYIWGNDWTPVPNNPAPRVSPWEAVIQQDRDFFLSAKPGYTPYTYPHPLRGSSVFTGQTPAGTHSDGPYELGMKIRSSEDGSINALRFYKVAGDTGTHIGRLWDSNGSELASATFIDETASGWQEMALSSPVSITAGTTYIVSVNSTGGYPATRGGFGNAIENGQLTGLADGTDGGNGVYSLAPGNFPTSTYNSANYFRDVVFAPAVYASLTGAMSIFTTQAPLNTYGDGPYELGMKFRSSQAGQVIKLRYYKIGIDAGTHTGRLWTGTGVQLASVTFTGETASGWQEMTLDNPVSIAADTTYIVSVNSVGGYGATPEDFIIPIRNGTLTGLASGTSGGNGVYNLTPGNFPTSTFNAGNYFRDIVFE